MITCGWCGVDGTYPHFLVSSGWVQLPAHTPRVLSLVGTCVLRPAVQLPPLSDGGRDTASACCGSCLVFGFFRVIIEWPSPLAVAVWPLRAPLSSSRPPILPPHQRQHRGARQQHGWGHGHCHPQCPPARPLLHAPPSRLSLGGQHPRPRGCVRACPPGARWRRGHAVRRLADGGGDGGGRGGGRAGRGACVRVRGWVVRVDLPVRYARGHRAEQNASWERMAALVGLCQRRRPPT